ncbi:hypothetical protein SO694_00065051 [Aureococcus anophagefferens]|uniref:Minichromosome loss protein Mcl1 middle region domain-containing protein n=1 Tax=Aureococcus anophagefferens TaxID=44056 RepID=A0ABR1FQP0_AURAN
MPANGRPAFRPSGESRQHTAAAGAAGETFARLPARRDGRNSVWNLAPGDVGQADADARTFLHLARPKPAPRAPRTLAQAKLDRAIADQIAEAAAAPSAHADDDDDDDGAPGPTREAEAADEPPPPPEEAEEEEPRVPRVRRPHDYQPITPYMLGNFPMPDDDADAYADGAAPPDDDDDDEERPRAPLDVPVLEDVGEHASLSPRRLSETPARAVAFADGGASSLRALTELADAPLPGGDDDDGALAEEAAVLALEDRPRAPSESQLALVASRRASGYPAGDDDPVARTSQLLVVGVDGSVRQAAWDFSGFLRLPRLAASDLGPADGRHNDTHRVDGLAKAQSGLLVALDARRATLGSVVVHADGYEIAPLTPGPLKLKGAPASAVRLASPCFTKRLPGGAETLCCVLKYSKALERATGVVDNDAIVTVDTEAGALEIIYVTSRRDVVGLSSAPLPDDVEDEPRAPAPGGAQRLDRKVRVAAPNFGYWSTSDGLCAVWLDSLRGPATERTVSKPKNGDADSLVPFTAGPLLPAEEGVALGARRRSTKAGPTTTTTLARYGRGSETGFEPLPASLQEIRDGKVRRPPTQILAGWRHPDHEDHPCECLAYSPRGELFGGGTSLWAIHDDGSRATALDLPVAAVAVAWGGLL